MALEKIASSIELKKEFANDAIKLDIATKYVESFGQLAKEGTTIIVPANAADASSMVSQMLTLFNTIQTNKK